MSLDEMQTTWSNQPNPAPASDARAWIDKTQREFRLHAIILIVAVVGNAIGLGLQLHRLIVVPERTLGNSGWELVIPALSFAICLGGSFLFRRALRKYRSLLHDTRRCLELVLREKKQEIVAHTRWIPAAFIGFLAIITLGKLQTIAGNIETPENAWSGVVMAAVLFLFTSICLIHRANAFLKPEIADLEQTLKSLLRG